LKGTSGVHPIGVLVEPLHVVDAEFCSGQMPPPLYSARMSPFTGCGHGGEECPCALSAAMTKRPRSPAGDPTTLGNMRANGVRSLAVSPGGRGDAERGDQGGGEVDQRQRQHEGRKHQRDASHHRFDLRAHDLMRRQRRRGDQVRRVLAGSTRRSATPKSNRGSQKVSIRCCGGRPRRPTSVPRVPRTCDWRRRISPRRDQYCTDQTSLSV
jgi:hypothetical protein